MLETPEADTVSSGDVTLTGYALDNRGIASVVALIDETHTIELTYGESRPDICIAWPGYPDCTMVGFTGTVPADALGGGPECGHTVEIIATDTDGNARTIDSRLLYNDSAP